jgi:LasA protease
MYLKFRTITASFFLVLLTVSCSTGGYWVPPASLPTSVPIMDIISATGTAAVTGLPRPEQTATPDELTDPSQVDPAPTDAVIASLPATPEVPAVNTAPFLYYAQAADSLPVVAVRFGVKPNEITSPDPIPEKSFINPGQLLIIPRRLANTTSSQHLLPDSEVVYSPSATDFDPNAYAEMAGGKLSSFQEWLKSTGTIRGSEMLERVAIENSINPRLLMALMEYESHWVTGQPSSQGERDYPMGLADPNQVGLYHQLVWAVNQLSIGYYAYREGRLAVIDFPNGMEAHLAPDLNAGTAALQYFFAQIHEGQQWLDDLDPAKGFPALYERMFGNPWERAQRVEPLFPPGLTQPPMTLPFTRNFLWSFTGGPHGAWEHDGAYAALDFAPGSMESGCVKSYAWVIASASGLVVRSEPGVVVLDLDGDGHEETGWVLLFLHVSTEGRVPLGKWVDAGDTIGHPSCEGGIATGTHLHIARKYNGEWIPAGGPIPFNLGGWVASAGSAAYKGTLTRDEQSIEACTCSAASTNIIRSDSDP